MDVIVARKSLETADIATFELINAEGGALPPFTAGAHIDVELPGGLTRQYSLCNAPDETHRYVLGVLKDPVSRGGSKALHEKVNEGDRLSISEPKNHFPLQEASKHSLLLAGGIGVTPILAMAERLTAIGHGFDMHYFTRSQMRTAFRDRIRAAAYVDHVHHYFDEGDPASRVDLGALLADPKEGTDLYVCGPTGFIQAVLDTARAAGWPEDRLNCEFFTAEVVTHDSDSDFEVELSSSGRVVTVPKGTSVVDALDAEGVSLPVSCEQGVCGTCVTKVLSGTPDHRDMFLLPAEQAANDQFMPCCSRSKTKRLVLDL